MKKFLLIFLVLLVIFNTATSYAYALSKQADNIVSALLRGDSADALDKSRSMALKTQGPEKAEALYLQGVTLISLDEYKEAREVFKKALDCAEDELSIEIYMGIGDTYFNQQLFDQAISVYEQVLNQYKNDNYQAMLYYKIGKAYQKQSEWVSSEEYFNRLKREYPESFENEIVSRDSSGGNFFTVQTGSFTNQQNARDLQADLKNKNYDAYITELLSNGQTLYRVRVGKFVSRIAAEYEEERLRTKEHLPTHMFP
ncbi:MAG: SPOR domain-containing protein [Candidatus Omnitrophota bacterium]